ncbi:MAG: HesA/MoeB/ThiF family protein [Campylobacterota bacterium]
MEDYFIRQTALWGEKTQQSLQEKSIAIIGCGGLGSHLGLTLGSSGIGTIYLVDFDLVSLHNLHRQVAFTLQDIDKPKATLLADLIKSRYDGVEIIPVVGSFDDFAAQEKDVDLILDATDNLPTREKIESYAKKSGTPWIYTSVEQWHGQLCLFKEAGFASAVTINDRKPEGIAPPIVALMAAYEANMVLRYLAGLAVKTDVLNYLSFDNKGQLKIQSFTMPKG